MSQPMPGGLPLPGSGPQVAVFPAPTRLASVRRFLGDWRIRISLVLLGVALVLAIFAPILAPFDPAKLNVGPLKQSPNFAYPLGTDPYGRDQLSRIIFGTRISVGVALIVAAGAFGVGFPVGLIVGYAGGKLDYIVGRTIDVVFAFPTMLLALILSTLLSPSLQTAIIALIVVYVPIVIRFVRGIVKSERTRDYIVGARVAGASPLRIVARHIIPNVTSPLLVLASSVMAFTVLAEAGLSYLGFGAQPPTSSWGKMLTENSAYFSTDPYLALFPGFAITLLVLAFNLLGDGLRDHLDPRYRTAL